MDILHLKKDEIKEMDIIEKSEALEYSFSTYNKRRVDLLIKAMSGKGKKGSQGRDDQGRAIPNVGDKMIWTHPKIQEYIDENKENEAEIKQALLNKTSYIPEYQKKEV
jgi:hypothetical protein